MVSQQVVDQLVGRRYVRDVRSQIDLVDVFEITFDNPEPIERDETNCSCVAATGTQLCGVFGKNQVAPRSASSCYFKQEPRRRRGDDELGTPGRKQKKKQHGDDGQPPPIAAAHDQRRPRAKIPTAPAAVTATASTIIARLSPVDPVGGPLTGSTLTKVVSGVGVKATDDWAAGDATDGVAGAADETGGAAVKAGVGSIEPKEEGVASVAIGAGVSE